MSAASNNQKKKGFRVEVATNHLGNTIKFTQVVTFASWLSSCSKRNLINDYGMFSEDYVIACPPFVRKRKRGDESETIKSYDQYEEFSTDEHKEWDPWKIPQTLYLEKDDDSSESESEEDEEDEHSAKKKKKKKTKKPRKDGSNDDDDAGEFTREEIEYNKNLNRSKFKAYRGCTLNLSNKDFEENKEYVKWFRNTVEKSDPFYMYTYPVNAAGMIDIKCEVKKTGYEPKIPKELADDVDGVNGPFGFIRLLRAGLVSQTANSKIIREMPFIWPMHEALRLSAPQLGTFCKNELITDRNEKRWNAARLEVDVFYFSGIGVAISWNFKGGPRGSSAVEIEENAWTWIDWDYFMKHSKITPKMPMASMRVFEMYPWSSRVIYSKRVAGINAAKDERKSFSESSSSGQRISHPPRGCDTNPCAASCIPPPEIRYRLLEAYLTLVDKGYKVKEGSKMHQAFSLYITESFIWILRVTSIRNSGDRLKTILENRPELALVMGPKFGYSVTQVALSLDKELSKDLSSQSLVRLHKALLLRSEVRIFGVIDYWLNVRDPKTFEPQDLLPLFMDLRFAWWLIPMFYKLDREHHLGIALIASEIRRPMPFRMSGAVTRKSLHEFRESTKGRMLVRLVRSFMAVQLFYLMWDACRWPQIMASMANPDILGWTEISDQDRAIYWLVLVFSTMDGECEALSLCASICNVHPEDMGFCFFVKEKFGREIQSWCPRTSRILYSHQIGFIPIASASYSLRKRAVRSTTMNGAFHTRKVKSSDIWFCD